MDRETQIAQFLTRIGWSDAQRQRVAGDASNRKYDRLTLVEGSTAILMDAPPETGEDVRPFVEIAAHLRTNGLSAPQIYHSDDANGLLLIEDFGDALFATLIQENRALELPLYHAAADVLTHLQDTPTPDLPLCESNWLTDMMTPVFDWYAPDIAPGTQAQFIDVFQPFAIAAAPDKPVLILRDYHAQNLLLLDDREGVQRVGLLDFQDAMLGHPAYDFVSFLQDARRDVSVEVEAEVLNCALPKLALDAEEFHRVYAILGLQRNLRILGIFARLCLRDGKTRYVDLIPRVWGYVQRNLAHPDLAPLAATLHNTLPTPTDPFLEHLKSQCHHSSSPH